MSRDIKKHRNDATKMFRTRTLYIIISDTMYPLGEISYKTFYQDDGYGMLKRIILMEDKQLLETIKIQDHMGEEYTIDRFFSILDKLRIYI